MKISSFHFDLPPELIAQYPPDERGRSRLLVLERETGKLADSSVKKLTEYIDKDTLLVFNNSRVRKARLFGSSSHGGKVEFLLIKQESPLVWQVMVSRASRQKPGKIFHLPDGIYAEIKGIKDNLRIIEFSEEITHEYLERNGHIPLPPYIKRKDEEKDWLRYQTVYADPVGSSAAPTAGLHFTEEMLSEINDKSAGILFVTLHVGMGTFLPVRTDKVENHKMHTEEYEIPESTAGKLNEAKRSGKKILAVGTTSVRTLESAFLGGEIRAGRNSTDLFIYPGYKFKYVDRMFTNFHTPDSSLIVMVNAFAGIENIKKAYNHAINEKYRFFSYGDAMLIL